MISIRKLQSLKPGTRSRKLLLLLKSIEIHLVKNERINTVYLSDLFNFICTDTEFSINIQKLSQKALQLLINNQTSELIRLINNMRYSLSESLGREIGDWDFYLINNKTEEKKSTPMKFKVFMEDIRSPFNVGSIFRTAECFAVEKIYITKDSASPEHKRAERSAMSCTKTVPWEIQDLNYIQKKHKNIFALELGGTDISTFDFPEDAVAIIGSEELGVSPEALKAAEKSLGTVSIPLYGNKASLNVSNAFAILMNSWNHYIRNYKQ